MRVGINASFLGMPSTGTGQYCLNLIQSLSGIDSNTEYLLFAPHSLDLQLNTNFTERVVKFPFAFEGRARLANRLLWEQISIPIAARKQKIDVIHVPYLASPLVSPAKVVVTIHDLAHLVPAAYWQRSLSYRLYLLTVMSAAKRADMIIAISSSSQKDIVRLLGVSPRKVQVIPYGINSTRFAPPDCDDRRQVLLEDFRLRYDIHKKYLLYVGNFEPRKNTLRLIKAFISLVRRMGRQYQLVMIGTGPDRNSATQIAHDAKMDRDIIFIDFIANDDLPAIYVGAELLVFPSLYEGFGLPPLEAMACGTPVITSNVASLPEVVGEAGLMVDPCDTRELVEAMFELLHNKSLRERLRKAGLARAKLFSWPETARRTLQTYKQVVESGY